MTFANNGTALIGRKQGRSTTRRIITQHYFDMEKTRVPKGEHYYWIMSSDGKFISIYDVDTNAFVDRERMKNGNYFNTEKEADAVARKLNAVLKGADVIEWPSEEEIDTEAYENNHIHKERGDCNFPNDLCIESFKEGVEWLKSKIVK